MLSDTMMDLLFAISVGLFLLINVFFIKVLLQDKKSWEDIKRRAQQSGIGRFTE